jgi:sugar O-acyltransferase (sialic acid O-acetyltransferase NeuD family)
VNFFTDGKLKPIHYLLLQLKAIDRIVIIGAVGTALNIIYQIKDAILNYNYPAELEGVIIDDLEPGSFVGDIPVLGSAKDIKRLIKDTNFRFIFCLYHMDKMKERFALLQSYNIPPDRLINFVHPLSYTSPDLHPGTGNVILSNSTIQTGVRIGNNNIINSNVIIEHDTIIGNGNFFSASVCIGAKVNIGNHCFIGLNASVRENVRLGENVFVGMHSLVLDNFSNVVIAGIPAKPLKKKEL